MAAGTDMGLSREFMPNWHHIITQGNLDGLGLVKAMVRPHYSFKSWDAVSLAYGVLKGHSVLRIPNGEGIVCQKSKVQNDCYAIGNAYVGTRRIQNL